MTDHSPGLEYEKRYRADGYVLIAGLDEAGRGCWAGPVTAGAVILPLDDPDLPHRMPDVRDSKLCTARQREAQYEVIAQVALAYASAQASAGEIDQMGIVPATLLAMSRALAKLALTPEALLIDGRYMRLKDTSIPQQALRKGELSSLSIAAASIIAKVERDRLLRELDREYPEYGFAHHKGYGTPQHQAALREFGPCPLHRRTFRPIRARLEMG